MFERAILHLDLDAFFVSVACLQNSKLKGKPLIIGGTSQRGVVASCSYEARAFGVRSAMPIKMALRLCPDAIILRGDMESYSTHSKVVSEIIKEDAPIFEKASIDEFYVDLSGMDKYFGCYQWSKNMRQRVIKETGLPISFGLSVNKLVSKVGAGQAKPNGEIMIQNGTEKNYLAPLSVSKLPSIGKVTYRKLSFMGIKTIKTLSQVPATLLQREFGKSGLSIWKKANAIDTTPVVPYNEKKSMSSERTFQTDTINIQWLKDQITKMVCKLAFELRQVPKLTSCVTIKLRYTDFNTYTKQMKIPYTSNDQTLIRVAQELFEKLYERRQLVRLIGVRFSGLVTGSYQINLFDDSVKDINLLKEMDHIRKRFGSNAIMRASCARTIRKE